jgi:hypothetical protein
MLPSFRSTSSTLRIGRGGPSRLALALALLGVSAADAARAQGTVIEPPVLRATSAPPMLRAVAEKPFLQAIAGRPLLDISIETPSQGALVADPSGIAFIAGRALARYGEAAAFDALFVIDKSDSTAEASGSDVNRDGVADDRLCTNVNRFIGVFARAVNLCDPTGDSILAAEAAAVRTLLRQLDPQKTRVGVVAFGGDDLPNTPDAFVAAPLTSNYPLVERALDAIVARGPQGRTNIEAAVEVSTRELVASRSIYNSLKEKPAQVMLFLSDGVPTLPVEGSIPQNRRLAVAAAERAAKLDIRMDTFGIGEEAVDQPETLAQMAALTSGAFTPVEEPRDLQPIFKQVNLAGIDQLRIANRANGVESTYQLLDEDGSFSALLPLVPGRNTIEITARASDGSTAVRRLTFDFNRDAAATELPPRLAALREQLTEQRLASLRERSAALQAEVDEVVRQALLQRIEAGRRKARERLREVRIEAQGADVAAPDVAAPPPAPVSSNTP